MITSLIAGAAIGFLLGLLGAGGPIIGLPIILLLSGLKGHMALGTNAAGVAMVSAAVLIWRFYKKDIFVKEGLLFTFPGLAGIYAGVQIGLIYPGKELVIYIGIILFLVSGWMIYISTKSSKNNSASESIQSSEKTLTKKKITGLIITALFVGTASGFFALGGGFFIVPGLILISELELKEASATALLPITAFSGLIGIQYAAANQADLTMAAMMIIPGIAGGITGIFLSKKLPKKTMQRIFAGFLIIVGIYMIYR